MMSNSEREGILNQHIYCIYSYLQDGSETETGTCTFENKIRKTSSYIWG